MKSSESALLSEWLSSPAIKAWAAVPTAIGGEDLRPYLFVAKDRKDYFGAASVLGHLAAVVEQLFGGKIAVQGLEADLKRLAPPEAAQIFEAVRGRIVCGDSFDTEPAGAAGIPPFDDLALFSGGLDSLIGAIDALEDGRTPLLISHAGEGATSDAQSTIFDTLKTHYRGRAFDRLRLWMAFPDGFVRGSGGENTTRGRSFLFFALGVFAGSGFEAPFTLKVPENGLIAVNVPLDPLRLGALSTRTTHPSTSPAGTMRSKGSA
ncbi:hypothetical protein SAMN04488498_14819 [Mesorhizobium albiziae]|uniref:Uncharacterized protein n=1 Tax=Neomesorhizobium albiziae TaxID=335020 RepID=A0A1I4FK64_9HYPH|nr:hypothetical protein [Mesorhizobium albiziae]GLS32583.1 hypothetical protein GCM10007937_42930 [Mesorhizobium albiziae]SFL17849.1 hypothetical protein SAMN04488498_14819 [Mesorhizobium albiziae]